MLPFPGVKLLLLRRSVDISVKPKMRSTRAPLAEEEGNGKTGNTRKTPQAVGSLVLQANAMMGSALPYKGYSKGALQGFSNKRATLITLRFWV